MSQREILQNVLDILGTGNFNSLVGIPESELIEFKASPYQLDTDRQKLELAKDVSSLANGNGGVIVIGVRTELSQERPCEIAKEIRAFTESNINLEQYLKVIASWIYPRLQIDAKWLSSNENSEEKGIAYIRVPESQADLRPFLTISVLQEDDKKVGNIVGLFQRKGDRVVHWTAQELHHIFKDGLRFDQYLSEITETVGKMASLTVATQPTGVATASANERIEKAIEAVGLKDDISYSLIAYPDTNVEIKGLFESRTSEVVKLIDDPPQLRYAGFDLRTGDSRIINGELRRGVIKDWKTLEVWRDGTILFVADGNEGFLCWGNYDKATFLRINTVALIESTYLFSSFVKKLFELAGKPECQVNMELHIRRNISQNSKEYGLPKAKKESRRLLFDYKNAFSWMTEPSINVSVTWMWENTSPENVAYMLISKLYSKFGVEHDLIPYVKEENGEKAIDKEQIVSLK